MGANNILADIELKTIDENTLRDGANNILNMTNELSKTIDDFRDFFKVTKDQELTSLKEVVASTLKIVGEFVEKKNIMIYTDIQSTETFESYPNELKQVILNLIKKEEEPRGHTAITG